MMVSHGSAVYCTLLLSDNYLPGAMVLAHSLRDNGTKAKLVALFTPDRLQASTVDELRTVYDELIPVSSMVNETPANLWLMDRPDLIATFTKIELWRLTQFQRIVYLDCDIVALRAPDELLSLEADFAAAPDVGWPDCFNSGMMALRPNLQDYYALRALAQRGISFDGADQGLLNMHFRDWHRLSFTYNCTPSANYQYIPAYKHFQSTISLIHFIGSQKPWTMPRQILPLESPYNQLLGRWWAVYDRHYRLPLVESAPVRKERMEVAPGEHAHDHHPPRYETQPTAEEQQSYHIDNPASFQGESHPTPAVEHGRSEPHHDCHHEHHHEHQHEHQHEHHHEHHHEHSGSVAAHTAHTEHAAVPLLSMVPQYVRGEEGVSTFIQPVPLAPIAFAPHLSHETHEAQSETQPQAQLQAQTGIHHHDGHIHQPQPIASITPIIEYRSPPPPAPVEEAPIFEAPRSEWDPSREPPPANTKPEGLSLQQKTYSMSEDVQLFQPPSSYPEAPKNMWYQVPPKSEPKPTTTTIFPWELHAPKPTRVFAYGPSVEAPIEPPAKASKEVVEHPVIPKQPEQPESIQKTTNPSEPSPSYTYTQPLFQPSAKSWQTYTPSNAWDEDPEIQRYIETIQARRTKPQVTSPGATIDSPDVPGRRPSTRITDFPTEVERPSLPVTPAPVHRTSYGYDTSDTAALPAAEGVPKQEEWVGVTVDVFSSLLNATYLLWRSIESPSSTRGAASEALGGHGVPRAAV
ncbi:hypothetical protein N7461_006126 [Penicillium sp. DV-2018c]|nr:hypothetical protein N7461_006126 [Penicillium sp. DV-2018c]